MSAVLRGSAGLPHQPSALFGQFDWKDFIFISYFIFICLLFQRQINMKYNIQK